MEQKENIVYKQRGLLAVAILLGAIIIDQVIKVTVKLSMFLHESFAVCGDWFYI